MDSPHSASFVDNEETGIPDSGSATSKPRAAYPEIVCSSVPSADKLEEYRRRVADTNIDSRSLLSTDYFNTFNSVVMVLDMLPDSPELLEEIEQWRFVDYIQHFKSSGLDFAELAIEVYPFSPPELREAFERKADGIRIVIEELPHTLRRLLNAGEKGAFSDICRTMATQLRLLMEEGNSIVHGNQASTQADIDKLF
ncbi:MAG: hypothetical protein WC521_07315 [Bdellovibrionales bacterium]|jgi:hypothetical protein